MSVSPGVRWHRARVARRRPEAGLAVRLTLDVPTWPGNAAGSHLDLRLTAPDGYQATRSYSLASSGATTTVELAVQELVDGEVSPFLVHELAEGEQIEVLGPLGRFFLWEPTDPDPAPVQLIGGGSGIVPLYAMAAAREREPSGAEFRLLSSVRAPRDQLFAAELGSLTHTRVDLVHTREGADGSRRPPGRLTRDELEALVLPAERTPRVFVCGPTPFVEAVAGWLVDLGHRPDSIRTERFGGP